MTTSMSTDHPRVLYVCSSGRSGSTLIDLLMGSHSHCFSLGEIDHLPKNMALNTLCSCGASARDCQFWRNVGDRIQASTGINWYAEPYRFCLGLHRAARVVDPKHQTRRYLAKRRIVLTLKELEFRLGLSPAPFRWMTRSFDDGVENTLALYDAVSTTSGRGVLIDSSKEYRKAIGLYRRRPGDVRVILLTRDGRGVFNSKARVDFSPRSSVVPWVDYYRHALPLIQKNILPEHWIRVRYEDLARNPEETLTAICDFAGLTFESSMLDFRSSEHHILNGNNMRFRKTEAIRLDERWRSELTSSDLAIFSKFGGDRMNRQLGYTT